MKRTIKSAVNLVVGLLAFWGLTNPAISADFKFDLANEYQASSLPGQTDADFAKVVAITSGGRI
ncbi:MAG TPA: hypothetical protein DES72_02260, partial [Gammaproteobacteria bacterium]|nr:hypothetical protein [Gammaproteobacteria bacterium]